MRNSNALRTFVCALLALVAVLAAPTAASAGSGQLSLIQDDAEMFGERPGEDPAAAMRELKDLGVDVLRTNVLFYRIYSRLNDRVKPAGFDTSDPNEPLYNWSATDRIVSLARANGIRLLFTVSGPGPHWASEQPSRCRFNRLCTWKPKPAEFGAFTAAVAKRYRGQVDWYALYNEPNLYTWITPEITRTKFGRVETGGVYYRKLWSAGYKAIRTYDPARRSRVLFGEVAAISAPLPMLYASLCLGPDGKPFRGRLRKLHACGGRPAKLNIGGWAIHPYNQGGFGPPSRRTNSRVALPQAYLPRLHRLMGQAAARGRVPGGRGIYITEFGYQTNPPDPVSSISPTRQGQYINESDRLFFGDRRSVPARRRAREAAVQQRPALRRRSEEAVLRGLPAAARGHAALVADGRGLRPGPARPRGARDGPIPEARAAGPDRRRLPDRRAAVAELGRDLPAQPEPGGRRHRALADQVGEPADRRRLLQPGCQGRQAAALLPRLTQRRGGAARLAPPTRWGLRASPRSL